MYKFKNINTKLLLTFMLIGILPLLIFGIVFLLNTYNTSVNDAKKNLESVRDAKYTQIDTFFNERESQAELLAKIVDTLKTSGEKRLQDVQDFHKQSVNDYLRTLESFVVNESNSLQVISLLSELEASYNYGTRDYNGSIQKYDNYLIDNPILATLDNVYIISNEGQILYSQQDKTEMDVVLSNNEYKNSGLSKVWKHVINEDKLSFQDFTMENLGLDEYRAFVGIPVFENGERIGVFAISIKSDIINQLIHQKNDIGSSAETYLAVDNNGIMQFRSNMATMGDGEYILGYEITNPPEYVKRTFQGESVNEILKDSENNMVVVSTSPIQVFDQRWIMVTKVDLEELIEIVDEEGNDYYADYALEHVYDDIFLIHPDGYVFHSVSEGMEYKNNLLSGEFINTNHAELIRKVNKTKEFVYVDYEADEMNDYKPRAFMGVPILDSENQIDFILSFEVSSRSINEIMLDRTSLGEYGEAYLIGPDYRLRSDTYLEPLTKNISNSFKDVKEGGIHSDSVLSVLGGNSDTVISKDYRGKNVLVSYEPISIYGHQWGLIVKQDSSETLHSLYNLIGYMILLGVITVIVVIISARFIASSISKPVIKMSQWAKDVANGSLDFVEIKTGNDEIGDMKESLSKVVKSLNNVSEICKEIAVGKLDNEFVERSDDDKLGVSINTMRNSFIQVINQANAISSNDYSVTIEQRSEDDELGIAMIHMVRQLKEASEIERRQGWIKNGQFRLNRIIRDSKNNRDLAKEAVSFISKYIEANTGILLVKRDDEYSMLGSYAFNVRRNDKFTILEGEGILGQAILEKEVIYLKDVPNDDMKIESATVDVKANHIIVVPCIFEDEVKGVIEIGGYTPFTDEHIEFLNKVQENLAIAIHSNTTKRELQELLDRTLIQSKELKNNEQILMKKNEELTQQTEALRKSEMQLQQQQEELRQSNEELEAQTMELKASQSKLQQQQEELRVTNEELEEKTHNLQRQKEEVAKKNAELEKTKQLIEEKAKEVEISSKYKSEFLANMSHELRTPLNSILILSGFLLEDKNGSLTKKEKEYAEVINSAGKDLLELINDILDLSKIESGKMDISIERFDIHKTMSELYNMFKPLTDKKNLKFINIIDDNVPDSVLSDEMKISQIIKNLISNAIKFTHEGKIEMKTELYEGDMLKITVKDTGIGISEDKLLHVFGAFHQADGTTSRNYGGTGLGLSITKELVQLLGGKIRMESEEGKGSVFFIIIPVELHEVNANVHKQEVFSEESKREITLLESELKNTQSEVAISNENSLQETQLMLDLLSDYESVILIIEDDKNFASILETMAKERGHEVICVDSGEKGLKVAEQIDISAIILDLGLPGMDGWEVFQKLKNWERTREIPIHIMSGKELDEKHQNLGFIDYLQKPISSEKLVAAFEKIEGVMNKIIRKLLVISSEDNMISEVERKFNGNLNDIKLMRAHSGAEAIRLLKEVTYDCIVIGPYINDISGEELAKKIRLNDISQTPIILYMEDKNVDGKNDDLVRYVESIIIMGDKSMSRLIDETMLFLNHIEESHRHKVNEFMKTADEKEAVLYGKKVLIVDDDMRNTFALSSVLEDKGMNIIVAKNGQIGIEKLQENPDVDIILMDIMMPVMDGYTAMRKIRSMNKKFSKVPIIALTAKAMREDKEKCISAGASDYLAKPIKMDELQTLMKVWVY